MGWERNCPSGINTTEETDRKDSFLARVALLPCKGTVPERLGLHHAAGQTRSVSESGRADDKTGWVPRQKHPVFSPVGVGVLRGSAQPARRASRRRMGRV